MCAILELSSCLRAIWQRLNLLFQGWWPIWAVLGYTESLREGDCPHFRATDIHWDYWWSWFNGNLWWGLYLCLDLLQQTFVVVPRQYPYSLWKVTVNTKGVARLPEVSVIDKRLHRSLMLCQNFARVVRWGTVTVAKEVEVWIFLQQHDAVQPHRNTICFPCFFTSFVFLHSK